ncbi:hypothetical protein [Bradyrhizobium liaoningense]
MLYTEAEWGRGQWEINVGHATALQTADAQIVLKLAVKDIASKQMRCRPSFTAQTEALPGSCRSKPGRIDNKLSSVKPSSS